jgi:hypothetical protein
MTDNHAPTGRTGTPGKPDDDRPPLTPGPVLSDHDRQRELVHASLIACPAAENGAHHRWA